jgi:hypothetical protein
LFEWPVCSQSNDQNLWMALGGNVKERTLPRKI